MERNLVPSTAGELITANPNLLSQKEEEVSKGEQALEMLKRTPGISKTRIARVRSRLTFLKRYIALLKEGFIPIPRLEYETIELTPDRSWDGKLHLYLDRMPIAALRNVAEFKGKFDEIGIVRPGRQGGRRRDPILIGIIRGAYQEEHFILYFWRPELYCDAELW